MGIFSEKTFDQKIKKEFNKEKKDFVDEKEGDNTFLSIPISNNSVEDSNKSFLYFNNSQDQVSASSYISPAMYDLIYKLELAVKSGKIDNESIELFNQATKLCSFEQILKISPAITASTLQLYVDRSKELSNQNILVENGNDKNSLPNNFDKPNSDFNDFKDFIRERRNPFEAQKELIDKALSDNSVGKKNSNNI